METTFRIVTGSDERSSAHLSHYGVLGMKWGVRRTPEQLGRHTIPKGTTIYRTTVDPNESSKGSTYVTYLKPDRDLYRVWSGGSRGGKPIYEKKYKLSKDLVVPSRKELTEVVNDVIKKDVNNKFLKEVSNTRFDWFTNNDSLLLSYYFSLDQSERDKLDVSGSDKADANISMENIKKKFEKDNRKVWVDNFMKKVSNDSPEELMSEVTMYFGSATKTKQAVIDELKKRGYNAMVDEASVGGINDRAREGVDPLIVFDQEDTLSLTKSSRVSDLSKNRAMNRYGKWRVTANRHNKNNQW